jgi:hypothetical protein
MLLTWGGPPLSSGGPKGTSTPTHSSGKQNLFVKFNEFWIRWDWVVHYKATKRTPVERAKEWRRFSERVERLAA